MEWKRFDVLTRLTTSAPRRRVLTGLLAASVGGVLGTRGVANALGDHDSRGQRYTSTTCKSPCRTCDGGRCVYACHGTDVCDANATVRHYAPYGTEEVISKAWYVLRA